MALEFYFADAAVDEAQFKRLLEDSRQLVLGELRFSLELGEFDKLTPFWDALSRWNIKARFFTDFCLPLWLIPTMQKMLIGLQGENAARRPSYHPGDHENSYKKVVALLDDAAVAGFCIVALCD